MSFFKPLNSKATLSVLQTKCTPQQGGNVSLFRNNSSKKHLLSENQKRFLNLHEYQSHQLFQKFSISTPSGGVASTPEEAEKIAKELNANGDFFVKAQILAGGRGKGTFTNGFKGGVHKAFSSEEVKEVSSKMLGQTLVTKQTGGKGKPVNKVFIQERVYSRRELYFAILLDRACGAPVMIGSTNGGMAIEDVAKENPDSIIKYVIDPVKGLEHEKLKEFAKKLGFNYSTNGMEQMERLYKLFKECDATQVEVNPMIETPQKHIVCADAKINIDDNADFRHPELFAMRDESQEDYRELKAHKYGLNYIGLDGNIGCIVNGAGLAMATMDIIKLHGGEPANFLDVGGGATREQIVEAFKILNSDKQVKAILVNIFGGIMKCDVIAMGIIHAASEVSLRTPLIVRLKGTNVEEAEKLFDESGVKILSAKDLDDAASKAVKIANIVESAKDININVNFELPI